MLNMMIALFYRTLPKKIVDLAGAFSSQDFVDAVEHMPNSVLPERRKKRSYLSSILSKNEFSKEGKNNRKLFFRVKRGHYLFNPNLALKVDDEWVNIYDLLSIDKLAPQHRKNEDWYGFDVNQHLADSLEKNKKNLKSQISVVQKS